MLYSHNGNKPAELPHRIRLSDGSTRTDRDTFTPEEIADAGFTEAPAFPTYEAGTHRVEWNSSLLDWSVIPLTEQELTHALNLKWAAIREERDMMLDDSDTLLLKEIETNGVVSQGLKDYRQSLRDIPQTYETPSDVVWPSLNSEQEDDAT